MYVHHLRIYVDWSSLKRRCLPTSSHHRGYGPLRNMLSVLGPPYWGLQVVKGAASCLLLACKGCHGGHLQVTITSEVIQNLARSQRTTQVQFFIRTSSCELKAFCKILSMQILKFAPSLCSLQGLSEARCCIGSQFEYALFQCNYVLWLMWSDRTAELPVEIWSTRLKLRSQSSRSGAAYWWWSHAWDAQAWYTKCQACEQKRERPHAESKIGSCSWPSRLLNHCSHPALSQIRYLFNRPYWLSVLALPPLLPFADQVDAGPF